MLYDGGFRTKEMVMMSWKDLNFDVPYMVTARTDKKTGTPRKVLLTACQEYLTAWRNEYPGKPVGNNPVFVTAHG
jgi:integrase